MDAEFPFNLILAVRSLNATWYILAGIAILFDLVTGFVIKGLIPRRVSSSVMREGLVHKAWEVSIIMCAALVDVAIFAGIGLHVQPMSAATCTFIFVMELASICENALEGNPELASAPIIKYVSQARDEQSKLVVKIDNSEPTGPDDTAYMGRHRG